MAGKPVPIENRFWPKVDRRGEDDCWLWIASRFPHGYGQVRHNNKPTQAHRVSFELATGRPVPDGMDILHSCDNPPCVNPKHLFIGTAVDNAIDMVSKGRCRHGNPDNRGERHGCHKLTEYDIHAIREWISEGGTDTVISAYYEVHRVTINAIRRGKLWGWLE